MTRRDTTPCPSPPLRDEPIPCSLIYPPSPTPTLDALLSREVLPHEIDEDPLPDGWQWSASGAKSFGLSSVFWAFGQLLVSHPADAPPPPPEVIAVVRRAGRP